MQHNEEGHVYWDEILQDGTQIEHEIKFEVTFYKDDKYNCDADGNRGITHAWTEEVYDYPHEGITEDQEKEIDKLIDDEIEILGTNLEL